MALNRELSDLFHSLAALMELRGENVFKVIAFQKVSRILRGLLTKLRLARRLLKMPSQQRPRAGRQAAQLRGSRHSVERTRTSSVHGASQRAMLSVTGSTSTSRCPRCIPSRATSESRG